MSVYSDGRNGKATLASSLDAAPLPRPARTRAGDKTSRRAGPRSSAPPPTESDLRYLELRQRVKDLVQLVVPRGATVLFISKGDEDLIDVPGRRGWHFPRAVNGLYAGCYPKDGREAIAHLRRLHGAGAEYLVVPSTAYWWLEFYEPLARLLGRKHVVAAYQEDVGVIYRLVGDPRVTIRLPSSGVTQAIGQPGHAATAPTKPRRGKRQGGSVSREEPLISVIMTTYNSAAYVERAVRNVLEQTHRRLEVVVVDDASTDDTFEILLAISREDPRVRPLKMFKNRGTYWCKNFGIVRSAGRYVTFQDSDDLSDPDRLCVQLRELQKTRAVMCTCNYLRVDGDDQVLLNRGRAERKAIMAPLFDKEQVIARAGYFDSVRTSADDEFTRRVGIVFGHERICHVDRPLYRAMVRDGSLTNEGRTKADISVVEESESDHSYLSAPRREYVRQYQLWHEQLKAGKDEPAMAFPLLRRPFAAPARLLADRHHRESYVTASMASIPSREGMLRRTVESILPYVDVLNVYLNGYPHTPAFLLDPKIHVVHSREYGDLGDNGKFFFLDSVLSGYHFTIDDDIVYPPDYVQNCILKIEQYDRRAIVGCHGVILPTPIEHFMKNREVLHFRKALARDRLVNLLGTGTTAYHVDALELSRDDFKEPGMADLWLAAAAKRQRVPMIAISRPERWLVPLDEADASSLYVAAVRDCRVQTEVAQREEPWRLDELYLSYPLLQELSARFSPEEIRSAALDLTPLLQPA